jgi:hypothetical protein
MTDYDAYSPAFFGGLYRMGQNGVSVFDTDKWRGAQTSQSKAVGTFIEHCIITLVGG